MLAPRMSALALALSLGLAAPAMAQTSAPAVVQQNFAPSHLQAARDVVTGSGIGNSFEGIYPEFRQRMRQNVTTRPDLQKDLEASIDALKGEAQKRIDEMVTAAARVFAAKMSEADLKEAAAFFNSPVGKRFNAARPEAINDIFNILQPWSIQTSDALYQALRVEMKKKGHDL